MPGKYREDIPASRVNITYPRDNDQDEVELPLKLLILGDYTQREDDTMLEDRQRRSIDGENFDDVMAGMKPGLEYQVENLLNGESDTLKGRLEFKRLADFEPENVADQIPEVRETLKLYHLLKDFKARVADSELKDALQAALKDPKQRAELKQDIDKMASLLGRHGFS